MKRALCILSIPALLGAAVLIPGVFSQGEEGPAAIDEKGAASVERSTKGFSLDLDRLRSEKDRFLDRVLGKKGMKLFKFVDPKLSVIGDVQALFTDDHCNENRNRFRIRSLELTASANVLPHLRGDFTGALEQEWEGGHLITRMDVEEAYGTLHSLPFGTEVQFGRKLIDFGLLNPIHPHHWPFADTPLVLESFFGDHPWNDDGAQASILIPNPWELYAKATFGFWSGKRLGHGHDHEHEHEDEGGDEDTHDHEDEHEHEEAHGHEEEEHEHEEAQVHEEEHEHEEEDPSCAHAEPVDWDRWVKTGRFSLDIPLSRNSHVLLGHSVAWDQHADTKLFGGDITFYYKWPNTYRKFRWQNEFIFGDLRERGEEKSGFYSLFLLTLDKHWEIGDRLDWMQVPGTIEHNEWANSIFLSFYFTHSIRFTTQYRLRKMACGETENALFLQWVIGLGPHAERLED